MSDSFDDSDFKDDNTLDRSESESDHPASKTGPFLHKKGAPTRQNSTAAAPKPNGNKPAWLSKNQLGGTKPTGTKPSASSRLKSISGGFSKPRPRYLQRIFQDDDSEEFDDPNEMDDFIVSDKVKVKDGEWREEEVQFVAGPRTSRKRVNYNESSEDDLEVSFQAAPAGRGIKRKRDLPSDETHQSTSLTTSGYFGSKMPSDEEIELAQKPQPKLRKKILDSDDDESLELVIQDSDEEEEDGSDSDSESTKQSQLGKLMKVAEAKVTAMKTQLENHGFKYDELKESILTAELAEKQPSILAPQCVLTPYQMVGMNWLYLLHQVQTNGILADEMGLGKTLQTISLFTLLKEKGEQQGPHLVVVPSSTLQQWANEVKRWSPSLRVEMYYGNQNDRYERGKELKNDQNSFDVCLTTYQLVNGKKDRKFMKKVNWHYLVLDEAQNIKNAFSQRFQVLFKLASKRRLLLTGTPLQNNLQELWSLLHFLMPKEFAQLGVQNYNEVFRDFIKTNKRDSSKRRKLSDKDEYIKRLKAILSPFVLRRLKSDVSKNLPEKKSRIEMCHMSETQLSLYKKVHRHSKSVWACVHQQEKGGEQTRGVVSMNGKSVSIHSFLNNILMQLRKTSNHPLLLRVFYDDATISKIASILHSDDSTYKKDTLMDVVSELESSSDWEIHQVCHRKQEQIPKLSSFCLTDSQIFDTSGKMNKLKQLLPELKLKGHRILIFSQMTKMMDILEVFLQHLDYNYLRLDGSTPVSARQDLINMFNTDDTYFLFLLSTRAGGLGINLTSADTVIFYDISFNPQVDRQAEDRCHRLGQTKEVNVITFLASGTCETNIYEMANEKKELNDLMLQEGSYRADLGAAGDPVDNAVIDDAEPPPSGDTLLQFMGDVLDSNQAE